MAEVSVHADKNPENGDESDLTSTNSSQQNVEYITNFNNDTTVRLVKQIVKEQLFRVVKFINKCNDDLVYSHTAPSICHFITSKIPQLNGSSDALRNRKFWQANKIHVIPALNRKRSSVTKAIWVKFQRTYPLHLGD